MAEKPDGYYEIVVEKVITRTYLVKAPSYDDAFKAFYLNEKALSFPQLTYEGGFKERGYPQLRSAKEIKNPEGRLPDFIYDPHQK
jgi:hypothetical protein